MSHNLNISHDHGNTRGDSEGDQGASGGDVDGNDNMMLSGESGCKSGYRKVSGLRV